MTTYDFGLFGGSVTLPDTPVWVYTTAEPITPDFWAYAVRLFDMANRKGEKAHGVPLGQFHVPSWFWDQAAGPAGLIGGRAATGYLFGYAARVDPALAPDALRYVVR